MISTAYHNYLNFLFILNSVVIFLSYDAFDFHKECSRMRWHRLSILITRLAPQEDQFGYYMANKEGVIQAWQGGVFRTNCIDCLDR